jgi:type IV pilus assembly protein PilE
MMKNHGFTLMELMVVTVIIATMVAIALPSYAHYVRKSHEKLVLQKIADVALKLEKEKSRNFSYEGFQLSGEDRTVKRSKSSTEIIYNITVVDTFQKWRIVGCVNSKLSNASSYKNFAENNKGSKCEWVDTDCTVPDNCK